MSTNSSTGFESSTKANIKRRHRNRCCVCLNKPPELVAAPIIDVTNVDPGRETTWKIFGVLPPEYDRSGDYNGIPLCSLCHVTYFSEGILSLGLPSFLVEKLCWRIHASPELHVHTVLDHILADPQILPWKDLYTLETLKPIYIRETNDRVHIFYEPGLSILVRGRWRPAPAETPPADPCVALIHQPRSLGDRAGIDLFIHPSDSNFSNQHKHRYWRVGVSPQGILARLLALTRGLEDWSPTLKAVNKLRLILLQRRFSLTSPVKDPEPLTSSFADGLPDEVDDEPRGSSGSSSGPIPSDSDSDNEAAPSRGESDSEWVPQADDGHWQFGPEGTATSNVFSISGFSL